MAALGLVYPRAACLGKASPGPLAIYVMVMALQRKQVIPENAGSISFIQGCKHFRFLFLRADFKHLRSYSTLNIY